MSFFNSATSSSSTKIFNFTKTLIIAISLLSQATLSEHVLINSAITKTVYTYSNGENHKTNKQLSFTNGDWFYLPSFQRLEFHTRTPGMLDFNIAIKSFYKVLYLEGSKRVLVFPQEPNGSNKRKPFVDSSMAELDDECIKIFPLKEEDLGNVEKLNVAFNGVTANSESILDLVFGNEKQKLIKEWNHLPFFNPTNKYNSIDSLQNKWALFKNFDQQLFKSLSLPTDKIMREINILKSVHYETIEKGTLKRLLKYVYYDDIELVYVNGMTNENRLKVWNINNTVDSMLVHVRYDREIRKPQNVDHKIKKLEEQLFEPMLQISKKMAIFFIKRFWTEFLDEFFNASKDTTINSKLYSRSKERALSPILPETLHYHQQIYQYSLDKITQANEKETKDDTDLEYKELGDLLLQAKDQFKKTLIEYFGIFIPAIKRAWETQETFNDDTMHFVPDEHELAPALKLMKQAGVDQDGNILKLKKGFDVSKPDEDYKQEFENLDFDRLFDDFMLEYHIGVSNDLLENLIFVKSLRSWNSFKDIGINSPLDSYGAFELAREFLYMFGGTPFALEIDSGFLKFDSEKIFIYKKDRIII